MAPFFLLLAAIILLAVALIVWMLHQKKRLAAAEMDFVRRQWRLVGGGTNPKSDLLEADKLLDFVLQRLGYVGSLGEKLKKADHRFTDKNAVWSAHKLRNRLAHEIDFTPGAAETRQALQSFARALRQLGVPLD